MGASRAPRVRRGSSSLPSCEAAARRAGTGGPASRLSAGRRRLRCATRRPPPPPRAHHRLRAHRCSEEVRAPALPALPALPAPPVPLPPAQRGASSLACGTPHPKVRARPRDRDHPDLSRPRLPTQPPTRPRHRHHHPPCHRRSRSRSRLRLRRRRRRRRLPKAHSPRTPKPGASTPPPALASWRRVVPAGCPAAPYRPARSVRTARVGSPPARGTRQRRWR